MYSVYFMSSHARLVHPSAMANLLPLCVLLLLSAPGMMRLDTVTDLVESGGDSMEDTVSDQS